MGAPVRISVTQNIPFQHLAQVTSVVGPAVNSAPVGLGSSLFLQRLFVPGMMVLSEIDLALGLSFPGTSLGAGAMYRSVVIYSFSNSTLLASLTSTTGSSFWLTGAAGVGSSATQFQAGWAGSVIAAFTLPNAVTLAPGEYVIGNMLEFSQLTSAWTVSLFGASAAAITSSGASVLSSAGLASGIVITNTSMSLASAAITAFSAAPTAVSVVPTAGLVTGSAFTSSAATAVLEGANTVQKIVGEAGATFITTLSLGTQIVSFASQTVLNAAVVAQAIGGGGLVSGYFVSTSSSVSAIGNAGTGGSAFLSTLGMTTGSVLTSATFVPAATGVGLSSLPNFAYFGNIIGSLPTFPSAFVAGIYSTNSPPASLTLTTGAGLTTNWGSGGFVQPWFCLIGE